MRESLKVVGIGVIRLIDKGTGRVRLEKAWRNDIHSGLASGVCGELAGEADVHVGKLEQCTLRDTDYNIIKTLSPPSTLEHRGYSDHDDVHAIWEDASSDEYTVGGVSIASVYNTTTRAIAFKSGLNVSKTSTDKLVVEWVINVYFKTPPW